MFCGWPRCQHLLGKKSVAQSKVRGGRRRTEGGYRSSVLHSYRVNDALTCELFYYIYSKLGMKRLFWCGKYVENILHWCKDLNITTPLPLSRRSTVISLALLAVPTIQTHRPPPTKPILFLLDKE